MKIMREHEASKGERISQGKMVRSFYGATRVTEYKERSRNLAGRNCHRKKRDETQFWETIEFIIIFMHTL
jgi:hypothetical protein